MVFIEDENLFKAVSFASSMIKKGTKIPIAVSRAAKYYDVNTSHVASELGRRGASVSNKSK